MKPRVLAASAAVFLATVSAGSYASAHELFIKPTVISAAAGTPLPLSVVSSHVFMRSQELEAPEDVRAAMVVDGKRTDIPLKADEGSLSYVATVNSPTDKAFFLAATRMPQVWATTPKGTAPATKKTPGAIDAFKIDKFAKTLINDTPDARGFDAVLGDPLEIVPTTNPASARVGDEISIKVLRSGQPLSTLVQATYDGFSTKEDTYAYSTQSKADGTAVVKVTQPGLWMVRVQSSVPEATEEYDRHVTRAVLVFSVK